MLVRPDGHTPRLKSTTPFTLVHSLFCSCTISASHGCIWSHDMPQCIHFPAASPTVDCSCTKYKGSTGVESSFVQVCLQPASFSTRDYAAKPLHDTPCTYQAAFIPRLRTIRMLYNVGPSSNVTTRCPMRLNTPDRTVLEDPKKRACVRCFILATDSLCHA